VVVNPPPCAVTAEAQRGQRRFTIYDSLFTSFGNPTTRAASRATKTSARTRSRESEAGGGARWRLPPTGGC